MRQPYKKPNKIKTNYEEIVKLIGENKSLKKQVNDMNERIKELYKAINQVQDNNQETLDKSLGNFKIIDEGYLSIGNLQLNYGTEENPDYHYYVYVYADAHIGDYDWNKCYITHTLECSIDIGDLSIEGFKKGNDYKINGETNQPLPSRWTTPIKYRIIAINPILD